jgi:hypothetical protein
MWDNVRLTVIDETVDESELLIDRTATVDYVLDIVDFGVQDTKYSLVNKKDIIGLEKDVWYKSLSVATITGWAVNDDRAGFMLSERKMFLNRFVVPKRKLLVEAVNPVRRMKSRCEIFLTQSIRYGTNENENNDAFCRFMITGVYRQDSFVTELF